MESTNLFKMSEIPGLSRQLYATFAVCLGAFSTGVAEGWSTPMASVLPSERREARCMSVSKHEMDTLISCTQVSSVVNLVICGVIFDSFGRKKGGWYLALLAAMGWIALASVPVLEKLCCVLAKPSLFSGAVLIGSGIAAGPVLGILFLSEISNDRIRGGLLCVLLFANSSGVLAAHVIGENVSYQAFNLTCFLSSLTCPIFFYRLPETPQSLVFKSRFDEARESIIWFHTNDPILVDSEMKKLEERKGKVGCKVILSSEIDRRSFKVIMFLFAFIELTGTTLMETYGGNIFDERFEGLSGRQANTVVAIVRFFGGLSSVYFVERSGRKRPLLISFLIMGLSLSVLIIFSYFGGFEAKFYVPLGCVIAYSIANEIFHTTAEVITGEIATSEIKGVVIACGTGLKVIISVLSLQLNDFINEYVFCGNMVYEGFFSFVGLSIACYIVPETKGKSLFDIRSELNQEILPACPQDSAIPIHREVRKQEEKGWKLKKMQLISSIKLKNQESK